MKSATRRRHGAAPAKSEGPAMARSLPDCFVALDFETADYKRDSACSLAVVRVERRKIVDRQHYLIRPPRKSFAFTYIHGITWKHVEREPSFVDVWRRVRNLLNGAAFIAAHNASFDAGVLGACCGCTSLQAPRLPFVCTMKLARRVWGLHPTKLPDVCRHLGLKLKHHDALSDAEACARIVIAAMNDGVTVL